ncbi:MAG: restriction endonuclease subunit S, partial [Neofamilia sp.]
LGEISESYSGGTPSVANQSYYGGSIPFIRSAEINSKNTELYLTEEGLNNSSAKLVEEGDILYALYGATSGEVGISQINGAINQAILAIKPKIEYDSNFIMQWLRRQKNLIISTYLQGGQGNLSGGIVKDLTLCIPTEYEEQTTIGSFFKQLDDTIALHLLKQRKLELLKQSLIKEILPQKDSVFPHLRLANFRDPWEQHQLKDVLKVNSGRDYKHLDEGNIPVYGTGGYMLSVDGKLSDVDGIGLGRKGTIDKPQYLKAPFWTVDTLFYLTPFPNYDIYFLYTLIQSINWKSMDESTGVPSLSKSVIESVALPFPILEEQRKIGSVFKQLDDTIALHQQKVAHLKTLKGTLLNKMFI